MVGRRNEAIDIYDLRGSSSARSRIIFPATSGPVTALLPLPDSSLMVGSCDNLRFLERPTTGSPTFKVVPGHVGGPISALGKFEEELEILDSLA